MRRNSVVLIAALLAVFHIGEPEAYGTDGEQELGELVLRTSGVIKQRFARELHAEYHPVSLEIGIPAPRRDPQEYRRLADRLKTGAIRPWLLNPRSESEAERPPARPGEETPFELPAASTEATERRITLAVAGNEELGSPSIFIKLFGTARRFDTLVEELKREPRAMGDSDLRRVLDGRDLGHMGDGGDTDALFVEDVWVAQAEYAFVFVRDARRVWGPEVIRVHEGSSRHVLRPLKPYDYTFRWTVVRDPAPAASRGSSARSGEALVVPGEPDDAVRLLCSQMGLRGESGSPCDRTLLASRQGLQPDRWRHIRIRFGPAYGSDVRAFIRVRKPSAGGRLMEPLGSLRDGSAALAQATSEDARWDRPGPAFGRGWFALDAGTPFRVPDPYHVELYVVGAKAAWGPHTVRWSGAKALDIRTPERTRSP